MIWKGGRGKDNIRKREGKEHCLALDLNTGCAPVIGVVLSGSVV